MVSEPINRRLLRGRSMVTLVAIGVLLLLLLSWRTLPVLTGQGNAAALGVPTPSRTAAPVSRPPAAPASPTRRPGSDLFATSTSLLLPSRVQAQLPQLHNGCEVTSLSMLLDAVGAPVDKLTLAREQPTDARQPVFSGPAGGLRAISAWGNPNRAFVGRVGDSYGYAIYHAPLATLLDSKLPGRAVDLSGQRFSDVLAQLRLRVPVVLWTTTTMRPPTSWVTWQTPDGPFRATPQEHAVLLVGYNPQGLIVDDPLAGTQRLVAAAPFIAAWQALGRQALSLRPAEK